jgi:glycosyltransferase involved in cell wall biosynthesis
MRTAPLDTRFAGRVVQVCEGLLRADGTSAQALALDDQFRALGLASSIHSRWFDAALAARRLPLEALQADEHDLLLVHADDPSGFALPAAMALHTTRVLVYHGLPPASLYAPGSPMEARLRAGRAQLAQAAGRFHRCWVGHEALIDELQALGIPRDRCDVVPPIVSPGRLTGTEATRTRGMWLSAARAQSHKRPQAVAALFDRVRTRQPDAARELWSIGRREAEDGEVIAPDPAAGRQAPGLVDDAQHQQLLRRAELFVSASAYERQGRALIEAVLAGLPVVALDRPGVAVAIGTPEALAASDDDLAALVEALAADPVRRRALAARQRRHARRFEPAAAATSLAAALSALLPAPRRFHQVSIVICTYNRAALLERCLDYLQHQTDTRFEVVVVNGPSTDDTEAVIARHADRIKLVRNPVANLSVSRNLGIAAAAGDLIAFIDDDAIPFDDWVARLLHEFGRRPLTTAALGGPVYYAGSLEFQAQDIGINERAEVLMDMPAGQVGRDGWSRSLLGTNVCLRADLLRAAGGFDEQFDYFLDESELTFRLQRQGWLVGYDPDLYLRHEFAQSANRGSLHHFNWFSICKNTAYFVARYAGLEGEALHGYLQARIRAERIEPLDAAVRSGALPPAERDRLVDQVRAGVQQGLQDAGAPRRRPALRDAGAVLRPFTTPSREPQIGRDLPPLHVCIVTREFPPHSGAGGIGTMYQHRCRNCCCWATMSR